MRLVFATIFCAATLFGQGAGGMQFHDWTAPGPTGKPAIACAELRSLTTFDLSVIGATVIQASANAPEHCRVSLMVPPEINIEVNLPTAWNGRLYMFGNGGWAGESFEAAGRAANRARGLKAGFVTAATDTGHSACIRTRGQLRAQPAEAARFRIPLDARDGRSRENDVANVLRSGPHEIVLRRLLAGRPARAHPRAALSQRLRRHHRWARPPLNQTRTIWRAPYWMQGAGDQSVSRGETGTSGEPGLRAVRCQRRIERRADRRSAPLRFQSRPRPAALRGRKRTRPTASRQTRSKRSSGSTAT